MTIIAISYALTKVIIFHAAVFAKRAAACFYTTFAVFTYHSVIVMMTFTALTINAIAACFALFT